MRVPRRSRARFEGYVSAGDARWFLALEERATRTTPVK
jgi:hypothetical protein